MKKHIALTAIIGAALAVATPKAFADTSIATETGSAEAPDSISVSGSIDQYVNFTTVVDAINLGQGTSADNLSVIGSPSSTQDLGDKWTTGGNSAKVEVDTNTHIQVTATPEGDAKLTDSGYGDKDYWLPTAYRMHVKGLQLSDDGVNFGPIGTAGDANGYADIPGALDAGTQDTAGSPKILYTGPGAGTGIIVDASVARNGLNDHYGTYETKITLTWLKH